MEGSLMKLILCGDLVPTQATRPAFDRADLRALMGDSLPVLRSGDFTVANLECALTDREEKIRKCGPNLKGMPSDARVIASCGFTHLGLSNNHVYDYGEAGMRDTVAAVQSAGMVPFGFGENDRDSRRPLILTKDGERTAIVAVCEHEYSYALPHRFGANPFDPFDTMQDIADAKKTCGHVIVLYHGGKEQCEYPSPRLRKACRAMIRAGASLVLTQHSHCIGCRERYLHGEIVYGQGNFNFVGHSDHPHWRSGLIVRAECGADGLKTEYLPVCVTDTGITLAPGTEKKALLDAFDARSAILCDEDKWMAEWEKFCFSLPYYVDAVRNAFTDVPQGEFCRQVFPHYLDCEAHLDVWHTVFKTWHAEG